ncbi:MAG: divalent metal cation transporter [Armatimonadetes bacterium]|nr:divalent metal cation transporter [Armatimonadota bacterium]
MSDKQGEGLFRQYLRTMGPGFMQSAMTLGGGSAFAAIFAGAAFGYQLLWVAPLGMLLGVIVMSAVAWQTLSTGMDPYDALKKHAHPLFAWAFAWGGLISSVIWQFAQYALAGAMLSLLLGVKPWVGGLIALAWCVPVGLLYGKGGKFVRSYELLLTGMVWFIIVSMLVVVVRAGVPESGSLLKGFVPSIPPDWTGTDAAGGPTSIATNLVIVSGLAAAVGANMLFVYPYTLIRNKWGRGERKVALLDLVLGMLIPFTIAVTLMVIASASVFHFGDGAFVGSMIKPEDAARVFSDPDRLGQTVGVWVFGLGILAMALSSITMQMLASGFAGVKLFGFQNDSIGHKAFTLLPAVGVLGAIWWGEMAAWVPVPTNVICGIFLPAAYLGFLILHIKKDYLREDSPVGGKRLFWNVGMIVAILVISIGVGNVLITELPKYIDKFGGGG